MQEEPRYPMADPEERASWQVTAGRAALFSGAHFLLAWAGSLTSPSGIPFATFWPPSGLFMAVLLIAPTRRWPAYVLAAVPAIIGFALLRGHPVTLSLFIAAGNCLEALAGAALMRRLVSRRWREGSLGWTALSLVICALLAPIASASIGTAGLIFHNRGSSWLQTWTCWWSADMIGVGVLTPLLLALRPLVRKPAPPLRPKAVLETAACVAGMLAAAWFVFYRLSPGFTGFKFILLPFVLWAGFRLSRGSISVMNLAVAVLVALLTTSGHGEFSSSPASPFSRVLSMDFFLLVYCGAALVLEAVVQERRTAMEGLRRQEERLRTATQTAEVGLWEWEPHSGAFWSSRENNAIHGLVPADAVGPGSLEELIGTIHPGDRQRAGAVLHGLLSGGQGEGPEYRVIHPDGSLRWVASRCGLRRDPAGSMRVFCGTRDVTAERLAARGLCASEEKYRGLFSEMGQGFSLQELVLDERGAPVDYVTLEVNRAFLEQTGSTREQVVGRRASEILPPEEHARWLGIFGPVGLGGEPEHYTSYSARLKKHFQGYIYSPAPGRFATLFADITDLQLTAGALKESEERYRLLFENAADAILLKNSEGEVIAANPAACALFGYTEEGFRRLRRENLVAPDSPRTTEAVAERDRQGRYTGVLTHRRADGTTFPAEVTSVLYSGADGRTQGLVAIRDIGERLRMEQELRRQAEELRTAKERLEFSQIAAGTAAWDWDIATNHLDWAPELFRMFGLGPDTPATFDAWSPIVHPEDRRAANERITRALEEHLFLDSEYRIIHSDGSLHWIHALGRGVYDDAGRPVRMTGICMNVTERKQAEEALRESELALRMVFEQAPIGIALADTAAARIIRANRRYCELLGRTEDQIRNIDIQSITHPDDWSRQAVLREGLLQGKTQHFTMEKRYLRPDGSMVWADLTVVHLYDGKGEGRYDLTMAQDLTERRRAEERQKTQQQKLVQAQKMASLGMLSAALAHEVNNPNHAITLNAGVMERFWEGLVPVLEEYRADYGDFSVAGMRYEELKGEMPTCIFGIQTAARHIGEIVAGLKVFSQVDDKPLMDLVDVNLVVKAAVTLMSKAVAQATSRFTVTLADGLPPVRGSFSRLEQVFINLLQNACDALPSIQAGIQAQTWLDAGSGRVCLSVKDEGVGMSREVRDRIQEPFFTTRRESGGLGLGITISQSIVETHGGEMGFDSSPGKGTRVTVSLPIASLARAGESP
jgi:PAS domain S-box-containing protein